MANRIILFTTSAIAIAVAANVALNDKGWKGVDAPGAIQTEEKVLQKGLMIGKEHSQSLKPNTYRLNECTQKGCSVFAEVILSTQVMYLYIDGEIRDTFKVSTGMNGYETPEMDLRPRGPMHTKFTSTKYPGGNYNGLGNMPYVVFLKGPYAIHGTTTGNIRKLGKKASHGCIRLHPDNAQVFFELVKSVGLENTWVSIKEEESFE